MKLPRGLSDSEVAGLLERHYGYRVTRSKGSHMTAELTAGGSTHRVTVPRHADVRVGTLNATPATWAEFLCMPKRKVRDMLFG